MKRKVMARVRSEQERELAKKLLEVTDDANGLIIGEIEEDQLSNARKSIPLCSLKQKPAAPRQVLGATPAPPTAPTGPDFYKIEFLQPFTERVKESLQKLGVKIIQRLPRSVDAPRETDPEGVARVASDRYTAYLTPAQLAELKQLPFIGEVDSYSEQDTASDEVFKPLPAAGAAGSGNAAVVLGGPGGALPPPPKPVHKNYEIYLHRAEDLAATLAWLRKQKGEIRFATGRTIRVRLPAAPDFLRSVAQLPAVASLDEMPRADLHIDFARKAVGLEDGAGAALKRFTQQGQGQIVAVADTGVDDSHPDLANQIAGLVAHGRPNNTTDPDGHGTHVAGLIVGDGTKSGGTITGVAPKAKLFFQSLYVAPGDELGGLPDDLSTLFAEAYLNGARVHSNSWGFETRSMYKSSSEQADEFVATHRDMLIVFSAGNYGTAANPRRSQQGFVDWYSIASPATAKNAITVGAGRSDKMIGPSNGQTHSARWPGFFPDKPISDEPIVGSVDSLYGPSSRGPCKGGLIKPDIIAPGTDIASTWPTTLAPGAGVQWGAYAGNPFYAYCGGTSMAAPIVAGCALLVREYFLSIGVKPSAAAVKATLINSARWMAGKDAVADHPAVINMHQGFGRLYMPWAIPNPMEPWLKLAFADTWQDPNDQLQRSGQTHYYTITVNGGAFLRICLAFTDLPAAGRQHEVHLIVRKGSTDFFGNQNGYDNDKVDFSAGEGDEHNNVEIVRIDNPSGTYNIEIFGRNLRETPQDYALVVAGELATTGPLKRVP